MEKSKGVALSTPTKVGSNGDKLLIFRYVSKSDDARDESDNVVLQSLNDLLIQSENENKHLKEENSTLKSEMHKQKRVSEV